MKVRIKFRPKTNTTRRDLQLCLPKTQARVSYFEPPAPELDPERTAFTAEVEMRAGVSTTHFVAAELSLAIAEHVDTLYSVSVSS